MPHELLEQLSVAREQTLDRIVARVEAAATSSERNPRCSSDLAARARRPSSRLPTTARVICGAPARPSLAWLPEDPWTIVSYRHFLRAIAERSSLSEPPLPAGARARDATCATR